MRYSICTMIAAEERRSRDILDMEIVIFILEERHAIFFGRRRKEREI